MIVFLSILLIVVFVSLVLVRGVRPQVSRLTHFEQKRRAKTDPVVADQLSKEQVIPLIIGLLQLKVAILLVVFVALAVAAYGWALGLVLSFVVAVTYQPLSRYRLAVRLSAKLYLRMQPTMMKVISKIRPYIEWTKTGWTAHDLHPVGSVEELQVIIEQSEAVLSKDQRQLLASGLSFADKIVKSAMTPRSQIDSIKKDEFLGPLVLSELHELGHSRLPVIAGDIDHVVGVLNLRDLLSLDVKKSLTAEKMMEPKVLYIHEDDTLEHALAAFIKHRRHLFIVINEMRETVGLITLEDVIEQLIGRQIKDEDDSHDDASAVAKRRGQRLNQPLDATDV